MKTPHPKKVERMPVRYVKKSEVSVVREKKQVVVDQELERIYDEYGTVTTDLVLEKASSAKHPLHRYFEWDDSRAAVKYRQAQATAMILASKMVVVLNEQGDAPPKAVAAQPEVRRLLSAFRGEGFKMRNEALSNDETRKAIVEKRLGVLRSWCNSTVDIDELQGIRTTILGVLP